MQEDYITFLWQYIIGFEKKGQKVQLRTIFFFRNNFSGKPRVWREYNCGLCIRKHLFFIVAFFVNTVIPYFCPLKQRISFANILPRQLITLPDDGKLFQWIALRDGILKIDPASLNSALTSEGIYEGNVRNVLRASFVKDLPFSPWRCHFRFCLEKSTVVATFRMRLQFQIFNNFLNRRHFDDKTSLGSFAELPTQTLMTKQENNFHAKIDILGPNIGNYLFL